MSALVELVQAARRNSEIKNILELRQLLLSSVQSEEGPKATLKQSHCEIDLEEIFQKENLNLNEKYFRALENVNLTSSTEPSTAIHNINESGKRVEFNLSTSIFNENIENNLSSVFENEPINFVPSSNLSQSPFQNKKSSSKKFSHINPLSKSLVSELLRSSDSENIMAFVNRAYTVILFFVDYI
jgi:hypothetical protein